MSDAEPMIDRWAEKLEERLAIEDFLDWCRPVELAEWSELGQTMHPVNAADLLDRFHGIDRVQLEAERWAILAALPSAKGGA